MTGKPKRGRPPMVEGEKRRNTINVRFDDAAHADIEQAALEAGRSQSGEIQHRVNEYQFLHRLLDDSVTISVAVCLEALRKGARTSAPASITNEETASLERAVLSAACIAELFTTVANHAGQALTEKWEAMLSEKWGQRVKAGDLADDFDIPATAAEISARQTNLTMKEGELMAFQMGATIGPNIWDVCFDKDDPLRSTSKEAGTGLMGNMSTLLTSGVGLPSLFLPPLLTEKERQARVKKLKSGAIRDAVKRRMSEGQYPGMSEKEAIEMLYDELLKPFGMDPDEAVPDVATG